MGHVFNNNTTETSLEEAYEDGYWTAARKVRSIVMFILESHADFNADSREVCDEVWNALAEISLEGNERYLGI